MWSLEQKETFTHQPSDNNKGISYLFKDLIYWGFDLFNLGQFDWIMYFMW